MSVLTCFRGHALLGDDAAELRQVDLEAELLGAGHVRESRDALFGEHEHGFQLLGVEVLLDVAGLLVEDLVVAAQDRGVALARVGVGHEGHPVALAGEVAQRDVVDGAEAEPGHLDLAGVVLGGLEQVVDVLEGAVRFNEEEGGHVLDAGDPDEVVHLVAGLPGRDGGQGVGDVVGDGVAVGLGRQQVRRAGIARGARLVRDGHGDPEERLGQLAERAHHLVRAAADAPGADEIDRARGVLVLGRGRARADHENDRQNPSDVKRASGLHGPYPPTLR